MGKSGYRYLWSWIEPGLTRTNMKNNQLTFNFYNNYISKAGDFAECNSGLVRTICIGY